MIYFQIFLIFLGVLSLIEHRISNKNAVRILLFIFLNLVFSFSISRGDYCSYSMIFKSIAQAEKSYIEIGFYALNYIISLFSDNANYVFVFSGLLSFFVKFVALQRLEKKFKFINFSLFFFIYAGLFLTHLEIGALRFAVAQSFMLLATTYLIGEKSYLKFYLLIFAGFLFHKGILPSIVLPLLFLLSFKNIIYLFILIIVPSILFLAFFDLILNTGLYDWIMATNYLYRIFSYAEFGSIKLTGQSVKELALLLGFTLVFYKNLKNKTSEFIWLIWLLNVFSFMLFTAFAFNQLIASRYLLFYSVLDAMIIILILNKLKFTIKFLATIGLTLVLMINLRYALIGANQGAGFYLPYKNHILNNKKTCLNPVFVDGITSECSKL